MLRNKRNERKKRNRNSTYEYCCCTEATAAILLLLREQRQEHSRAPESHTHRDGHPHPGTCTNLGGARLTHSLSILQSRV